jgi:O-antigen ligase
MSAPLVLIIFLAIFLLLLRFRTGDFFLRAYGMFFVILVVFASNKEYYGITPSFSEGIFSSLSLIRWGLLCFLIWQTLNLQKPGAFRIDVILGVVVVLLLIDMMFSSVYAESFSYSFMRASSFAMLAFVITRGLAIYLFSSVNCLRFFRLKYYTAWLALAPLLLMHLSGIDYGVTIIMGQYAGFFGNQNMFGIFSAMITPYVLFHWRVIAQKKWEKCLDLGLLLIILSGLYLSKSRNGMITCLIAIAIYFFIINLQSRIKMLVTAVCLVFALIISPALNTDLTSFLRKSLVKNPFVDSFSSHILEERRYEIWSGVWPIFWKQKLTGYGFASSHLFVFPFTQDEEVGRTVHNSYLEIFGDLGLPGLILLLIILFRIGVKTSTLTLHRGEFLERHINAVFISLFIAGSINAIFESWMFSVGNLISLFYWGSVAGIVARWARCPVTANERSAGPRRQPGLQYPAVRHQY